MKSSIARIAVWCNLVLLSVPAPAVVITNQFSLTNGWNAIWLEVDIKDAGGKLRTPGEIFANTPVSMVATYFPEEGPMEFYTNQVETSITQEGWAAWRRGNPAQNNTLNALTGMRAYLVKSDSVFNWSAAGQPVFHVYRWIPDSYNLVGFGVLANSLPTFQTVFGPAEEALNVNNIYELRDGANWMAVNPASQMKAGAAYWVYARGQPTYQGPFLMDIPGVGELDYGADTREQELLVYNGTAVAINLRIDRMSPPNGLELIQLIGSPTRPGWRDGPVINQFVMDSLPSQKSLVLNLRADRSAANWHSATNIQLYRVSSTNTGTYCWLPVTAVRSDLLPAASTPVPVPESTGLWVGEVSIQTVSHHYPDPINTSSPYPEPVTAAPKGRVLFHVNANGEVKLLKAVTLMRRKSPEGKPGESVLVVNPEKIPYLQGIEKRNGRLVGKRIETTFYDLPRAGTTNAADQVYYTSLPFTGGLGPGNRCNGTLTLDTYHRANPFRHPYHPDFIAAPNLSRQWTLSFDPTNETLLTQYPEYGHNLLTGTFNEAVTGLVRPTEYIKVTGRFLLRRVAENSRLE